ncbi:KGG domain-containing protein [Hymenobacter fodinae]|uniref:General stress protein n=1 Tax=Hymenobacter fodinae TaxID=2510796 RepID=A0A4Z0P5N3_9BACT|nr:KGG domain-containing protein [Hymenobacter fodinae]TGE06559.1 general stress protein [Hymenobacter fodinae]
MAQASKNQNASTKGQTTNGQTSNTSKRGFASMDPELQRRIASEGGRASHQSGRGHRFTSEEARAAGRKGGQASRNTNTNNNAQAR